MFTLKIFIMANIIQCGKPYALLLVLRTVHGHDDQANAIMCSHFEKVQRN